MLLGDLHKNFESFKSSKRGDTLFGKLGIFSTHGGVYPGALNCCNLLQASPDCVN